MLGAQVINGRGELLTFGGQVMKNVAGYDVSRLMAGAMGTLGVLAEVSIKVLPVAPVSCTHLDVYKRQPRHFAGHAARGAARANGASTQAIARSHPSL